MACNCKGQLISEVNQMQFFNTVLAFVCVRILHLVNFCFFNFLSLILSVNLSFTYSF
jgi:hypothetical protein